jgi:hypothetical protein
VKEDARIPLCIGLRQVEKRHIDRLTELEICGFGNVEGHRASGDLFAFCESSYMSRGGGGHSASLTVGRG